MLHFQIPPSSVSQKSLVSDPPPGFPVGPLWSVMPISKYFFISYSILSKGAPPPSTPNRGPIERGSP
jgi:hypothetical protein